MKEAIAKGDYADNSVNKEPPQARQQQPTTATPAAAAAGAEEWEAAGCTPAPAPAAPAVAVAARHFAEALQMVAPSVSQQQLDMYEKLRKKMCASRAHVRAPPVAASAAAAGGAARVGVEGGASDLGGPQDMDGASSGEDPLPMEAS